RFASRAGSARSSRCRRRRRTGPSRSAPAAPYRRSSGFNSSGPWVMAARHSRSTSQGRDNLRRMLFAAIAAAMFAMPASALAARPWSLDPAPCPGTCATPNIPLKDWYHRYAAKFPSVVKEEVIGHSVQGQDIVAYKVTQGAKDIPDATRPTVLFDSTQHAREWI